MTKGSKWQLQESTRSFIDTVETVHANRDAVTKACHGQPQKAQRAASASQPKYRQSPAEDANHQVHFRTFGAQAFEGKGDFSLQKPQKECLCVEGRKTSHSTLIHQQPQCVRVSLSGTSQNKSHGWLIEVETHRTSPTRGYY
jgi:hypothetical protein